MKRLKKIIGYAFLIILIYVGYVLISTGYFRTIENSFEGKLVKKIKIAGAEDIMVTEEGVSINFCIS